MAVPHPPPGPARRRLVALCVVALGALVLGIVVGAGSGSPAPKHAIAATQPPKRAVAKAKALSVRRQIGQLLMIAFPGTTAPSYVKDALRRGRAAALSGSASTAMRCCGGRGSCRARAMPSPGARRP